MEYKDRGTIADLIKKVKKFWKNLMD